VALRTYCVVGKAHAKKGTAAVFHARR
jgi:hypothetical protein